MWVVGVAAAVVRLRSLVTAVRQVHLVCPVRLGLAGRGAPATGVAVAAVAVAVLAAMAVQAEVGVGFLVARVVAMAAAVATAERASAPQAT